RSSSRTRRRRRSASSRAARAWAATITARSTSVSTWLGSSIDYKESLTMKRLSPIAVVLALLAAGCSSNSTPTNPTPTNPTFTATLSPANEVPPITNAESTVNGTASITLITAKDAAGNVTSATATFVVNLQGFPAGSAVNIAHIHEGANTCACPVV